MVTCPGEREMRRGGALTGGRGDLRAARIPCGLDMNQRPMTPCASQSDYQGHVFKNEMFFVYIIDQ